jgi:hypothetical protein
VFMKAWSRIIANTGGFVSSGPFPLQLGYECSRAECYHSHIQIALPLEPSKIAFCAASGCLLTRSWRRLLPPVSLWWLASTVVTIPSGSALGWIKLLILKSTLSLSYHTHRFETLTQKGYGASPPSITFPHRLQ